ncbi:2-oxoglutarate and iron-dependent oxygenase domain-containing protein [Streptomyces diastatochromogenes]|uniref:2-oxoglutarate and iron-dependent oxygenase domain-containing protein n=1 Tax=Streptomyces diastatochromogenes TaxID=42236 RepID=UPI00365248AC
MSRFRAPDTDCDTFLAELRSAAYEVGFFYVTGDGVPASLREEVLNAAGPSTRRAVPTGASRSTSARSVRHWTPARTIPTACATSGRTNGLPRYRS